MGVYGEFNIEKAVSVMRIDQLYRIDPNKPLYELMMLEFKKRIETHRDLEFSSDYRFIRRIETIDQFNDEEFQFKKREQNFDIFLDWLDQASKEWVLERKKPGYQWPVSAEESKK